MQGGTLSRRRFRNRRDDVPPYDLLLFNSDPSIFKKREIGIHPYSAIGCDAAGAKPGGVIGISFPKVQLA